MNLDEARRVLHTRIANTVVSVEDAYGTLITYPISDALATAEIAAIVASLTTEAIVDEFAHLPTDGTSERDYICIPLTERDPLIRRGDEFEPDFPT